MSIDVNDITLNANRLNVKEIQVIYSPTQYLCMANYQVADIILELRIHQAQVRAAPAYIYQG